MEAALEGGISNAEQPLETLCNTPGLGMPDGVRMLQALQQQRTQASSLCL